MKPLLPIILLSIFFSLVRGEPIPTRHASVKNGISFHSAVNGVLLECYVSRDRLNKSGGALSKENGWQEPRGKISLLKASSLAMKEATRVLGDKIQSEEPTWHLESAIRKGEGGDSNYAYYYRFSFVPFYGTKDSRRKYETQLLQVIVLLDGTVLPTIKHNSEQGGADQPATAPESKPESNEKPKPESEGRSQ